MYCYCTLEDLNKKIPEQALIALTDDEATGAVNQARVDESIQAASEEIDLYIGKVARLPIDPAGIPAMLRNLAAVIAIYQLYARRKEEIPETRKDQYKNAVKTLEKILKGEISIGLEPPPEAPPNRDVKTASREQIFDEETLEKF